MRIALTQFEPSPEPAANADRLVADARRASADGAALLLAPEGSLVSFLTDPQAPPRSAQPVDGPFARALIQASGDFAITIAAGSFVPDPDSGRVFNELLVAAGGQLITTYRKVHLYDAFSFLESDTITAGTQAPPVIDVDGVRVGLATCYDLRFPELFRTLVDRGAQVLAVASAWVRGPMKEEHWLTLLRARAIENTCYVVAADQVGGAGIGRSAAFDPAGVPLLDLGADNPGYGIVEIDPARITRVRDTNPALAGRRFLVTSQPD